jgi:hypothetical protein
MPCNSDHMEQTPKEASIQHAAHVLADAHTLLGIDVPRWVLDANKYYADNEDVIPTLCEILNGKEEDGNIDALLYSDARNLRRRRLADWWERHKKVDRDRKNQEMADAHQALTRQGALAKLTPLERDALGY